MKPKKRKEESSWGVHPLIYALVLLLPLLLYTLCVLLIFPAKEIGFIVLGIAGTLFLGIVFCVMLSLTGSTKRKTNKKAQRRKILLCVVPILVCLLMVGLSLCFLYIPGLYDGLVSLEAINKNYFFYWIFLALPFISYCFARLNVREILRQKKVRADEINRLTKGYANYWFYLALHREQQLSSVFYINAGFLLTFVPALLLQTSLGWWAPSSYIIAVLLSVSNAISGTALLVWGIASDFALLRLKKNKKHSGTVGGFIGYFSWVALCMASTLTVLGHTFR